MRKLLDFDDVHSWDGKSREKQWYENVESTTAVALDKIHRDVVLTPIPMRKTRVVRHMEDRDAYVRVVEDTAGKDKLFELFFDDQSIHAVVSFNVDNGR